MTKHATLPYQNRIVLIFDFDETLAPDTFNALLQHCDIDPDQFDDNLEPLLESGWDKKMARFYRLIQESRQSDDLKITSQTFEEVGRNIELYPDVEKMFDRVRDIAREIVDDIEVEFYMLTAGMLEIPRATAVKDDFRVLWGGELHFDEDTDELAFVKRTISYPDKIRYLLKLCKGLDIDDPKITHDVYQSIPEEEWHVPFDQVIFVGDGDSDMPIFAYLKEKGGLAIGVFQADEAAGWEGYQDTHEGRRVQNLAPSDFRPDSELMESISLAVRSIANNISLKAWGQDE